MKQIIDLDGALLQRHPDEGQPLGRSLDDAAQAGDVLDRELPPELLFQAQNFEEVTISVAQTDLKSNFTILNEIEIQFKRKVCVRFTLFLRYSVITWCKLIEVATGFFTFSILHKVSLGSPSLSQATMRYNLF